MIHPATRCIGFDCTEATTARPSPGLVGRPAAPPANPPANPPTRHSMTSSKAGAGEAATMAARGDDAVRRRRTTLQRIRAINAAASAGDIAALQRFAREPPGFVHDGVRRRAWAALAGIDLATVQPLPESTRPVPPADAPHRTARAQATKGGGGHRLTGLLCCWVGSGCGPQRRRRTPKRTKSCWTLHGRPRTSPGGVRSLRRLGGGQPRG